MSFGSVNTTTRHELVHIRTKKKKRNTNTNSLEASYNRIKHSSSIISDINCLKFFSIWIHTYRRVCAYLFFIVCPFWPPMVCGPDACGCLEYVRSLNSRGLSKESMANDISFSSHTVKQCLIVACIFYLFIY